MNQLDAWSIRECLEERLEFFVGLGGVEEGLGDFFAQEFPVAFAEAVDRHAHGGFANTQGGAGLGTINGAFALGEGGFQLFKEL